MLEIMKSTARLMIQNKLKRFNAAVKLFFAAHSNYKYQGAALRILSVIAVLFSFVSATNSLQVYPRVITPNGDGWNDKVIFQFENPAILPSRGEVFDVTGAKIGEMLPGPAPDTTLIWDGKRGGDTLSSGVYIYQIEIGKKIMTGAIVVAE